MTLSWATIYTITWKQVSAGTVRILIIDSNSAAKVTIPSLDGVAGANTYLWTVPNSARIASGTYKTRVQSTVTTSQMADSASYSIVACTFNPCRVSGSTCSNPSGQCTCPSGVAASICNPTTTDPCASVSCKNSGTCSDGACVCTTGWTGSDCSTATTSCPLSCLNGGAPDAACKTCQCSLLYAGTNCEYMQLCLSAKLNIKYTIINANSATYAKNFKNDIAKAISITPDQVTSVTFTAASDGLTTVNFCLTGSPASSSLELAASLNTIMSNPSSTLAQGDVTSSTEGGFEAVDQLGSSSGKSWLDKNLIPLVVGLAGGALFVAIGVGIAYKKGYIGKGEKKLTEWQLRTSASTSSIGETLPGTPETPGALPSSMSTESLPQMSPVASHTQAPASFVRQRNPSSTSIPIPPPPEH